jgi:gluconate 2-dehydrogenase gamma chain
MHRRDLLRLISAVAVTPVLSPDLFAMLQEAQPSPDYRLRTLSPTQNQIVVTMTDIILPATATPGAKAARVNEFIDVILTDWATPEERRDFLAGLADVDRRSEALFAKDFLSCAPEQQSALLRAMDDAVDWSYHHRRARNSVPPEQRDTQLQGEFFRVFKILTLHGFYTSEIGFTQELKLEIIPGAQHGCVPAPAENPVEKKA